MPALSSLPMTIRHTPDVSPLRRQGAIQVGVEAAEATLNKALSEIAQVPK